MRNTMRMARMISLGWLVGLAGCFSLGRTEPPQRHYVLGGERVQENAAASGERAGLVVGVRRLRLVSYLEAPFLVVREEPNRIGYSEFHRWGEPLGDGINRTVASDLASRAAIRSVDVAPWPAREEYDYLVQLHVTRFEGVAPEAGAAGQGEVHMSATWEILRQRDGAVLARGTTDYRDDSWRVGDYAGLVSRLDAGLKALSEELASSLASLGTPLAERR